MLTVAEFTVVILLLCSLDPLMKYAVHPIIVNNTTFGRTLK